MSKLTKKHMTRDLPRLTKQNEYRVDWRDVCNYGYSLTFICSDEITAARYAREQENAYKVTKIELLREGIYA